MGYFVLRKMALEPQHITKAAKTSFSQGSDNWADEEAPVKISGLGAKSIGILGSLCLVCNNIIGPGMFQLPGLFQQAGWFPCLSLMLLAGVWTTQSSLFVAKTMQSFPSKDGRKDNVDFGRRLEINKLAHNLLPKWGYYLTMFTLCAVLFSQNVANIIMVSQVMDATVLEIGGRCCALDMNARFAPMCVGADTDGIVADSLFGDKFVISTGYAISLVVTIPLGILNLDDNINIQIGGMVLTLVCIAVWVLNFCYIGLVPTFMPAFGSDAGSYMPLLSTIMFNYGFVATIPSWLNEKTANVPTAAVICWASVAASAQYIFTSLFAALAIENLDDTDLLSVLNEGGLPGVWYASKIMTFVFPIANVLTSIPVFSIILRYNLLQLEGVKFPVSLANLIAVVLPWVVTLPFYPGNALNLLITWSSAVLFVLLNLIIPLSMYLVSVSRRSKGEDLLVMGSDNYEQAEVEGKLALLSAVTEEKDEDVLKDADVEVQDAPLKSVAKEDRVFALFSLCFRNREAAEPRYARGLLYISCFLAVATFVLQMLQQWID